MYFPMELKHNPTGKDDIDAERERRAEILEELMVSMKESAMGLGEFSEEGDEEFNSAPSEELEALLPYYNQVEDEALKVAKKYFCGTFQSQKLFEYEHHGNIYRCYVDICNENKKEINIIEVKATTSRKYSYWKDKNGVNKGLFFSDAHRTTKDKIKNTYPLFVKDRKNLRKNGRMRAKCDKWLVLIPFLCYPAIFIISAEIAVYGGY